MTAATAVRERPILFSGEMVRAILAGKKTRKKLYAPKGIDRNSPEHIAARLANGLKGPQSADQCWQWARTKNNHGYGTMTVNGRTAYAHRLAYELGTGQSIPTGMHVCHKCDTPGCVNPTHLFLGTRSDNMADCHAKGRSAIKGHSMPCEANPASKLTTAEVEVIRCRLVSGDSQAAIALDYGVSQSQINNIKRGRQWK